MARAPVTITMDTRAYNRASREFAKGSSRTFAECTNQNAYNVTLAASKINRKADKAKIIAELGPEARTVIGSKIRILKSGVVKRGKDILSAKSYRKNEAGAPILALIINSRRGKAGQPGLRGPQMREAIEKEYLRRMRSIGYMRSGWLAAIGNLAAKIGKPFKRRKATLGGSTAAQPGTKATAHIWNTAFSTEKNTSNPAPDTYAEQALSEAMTQQIGRMAKWAAGRMQRLANRQAARFVR